MKNAGVFSILFVLVQLAVAVMADARIVAARNYRKNKAKMKVKKKKPK